MTYLLEIVFMISQQVVGVIFWAFWALVLISGLDDIFTKWWNEGRGGK